MKLHVGLTYLKHTLGLCLIQYSVYIVVVVADAAANQRNFRIPRVPRLGYEWRHKCVWFVPMTDPTVHAAIHQTICLSTEQIIQNNI